MANRYRDQYGANEIPMEAADSGFLGVNLMLDPGLLKTGAAYRDVNQMLAGPGIAAGAINMRFARGVAETRAGTIAPTWCNPRATRLGEFASNELTRYANAKDDTRELGCVLVEFPLPNAYPQLAGNWLLFNTGTLVDGKPSWIYFVSGGGYGGVQWNAIEGKWQFYLLRFSPYFFAEAYATGNTDYPWQATWPSSVSLTTSAFVAPSPVSMQMRVTRVPYVSPWSEPILAAAPFADPDGVEWLVLAFASRVVRCRQAEPPRVIPLPAGLTLQAPVKLLQTFDSMVMLRGFDRQPLAWDGDDGSGFEAIPEADPNGSYTASISNAETGAVMNNRLFLPFDRDTVAVSDILDFTRYDAQLNAFRINTGEDDAIVAVFPFRRTNLLVFKSHSTHVITDVTGDLSNVGAEIVNSEIGCVAANSIAAVGGDVFFLAQGGIYQVSEIIEQSMQVQEFPVSQPIEPLMRRINWNYAHLAQAVVMGDCYRLAVPIDGATRNNAVLVYDTVRGYWQGYDTYPDDFAPDLFTKGKHDGRRRAIAIDQARAVVCVLDIGATDAARRAEATLTDPYPYIIDEFQITSQLTTRGYILLDDGPKRLRHGTVTLETWNPSFTIETVTEGVNEFATIMADRTRDRTKWHLHGKADYDTTNAAHNHAAPKRRDYSVPIPSGGIELDTGIRLQQMQESIEQFPIRQHGRWLALRITNTQGRIAVKAAGIDGMNIRNSNRIHA